MSLIEQKKTNAILNLQSGKRIGLENIPVSVLDDLIQKITKSGDGRINFGINRQIIVFHRSVEYIEKFSVDIELSMNAGEIKLSWIDEK